MMRLICRKVRRCLMRTKSVIIKILLVFLSIIIAFVLCESILNFYIKIVPEFKDKLKPFLYDKEQVHPYCGQQVPIDYVRAQKTEPNEYIVVLTGGSTAFGVGASCWDRIIPKLLERYLNKENRFSNISRFIVVNATNPSYHTTQEKNVLMHFLHLQSDMDMFVCVDGFNNLARPLENYVYQLPLNYPGWPWIVSNFIDCGRSELYYLGKSFEKIRDKNIIKKSKILYIVINKIVAILLQNYYRDWHFSIFDKLDKVEDEKKIQILYESADFYKEDIIEMSAISKMHKVRTLFVLQPLLGFGKDKLTTEESAVIEEKAMYDYGLASQEIWVSGHKRLREVGQELKNMGIDFLDFTEIFKDETRRTHKDLMHMNDTGQEIFSKRLASEIITRLEKIPLGKLKN